MDQARGRGWDRVERSTWLDQVPTRGRGVIVVSCGAGLALGLGLDSARLVIESARDVLVTVKERIAE